MCKKELGKQIETLRKECGVSTYELEQKGIHPSLPATIEKGKKGYSIDTLIKYLNAIDEDIFLSVGKIGHNVEGICEVQDSENPNFKNAETLKARTKNKY